MSLFAEAEYRARCEKAQALMADKGLSALLLTTEAEHFYFTGYLTRFWQSPCRPWFLILPATGKPVAVIPSIGAVLMGQTWVEDIRTWSAPDLEDDGVSLVAEALNELVGTGTVGIPSGHMMPLRMPLGDLERIKAATSVTWDGDHGIIRQLRMVKSEGEIDRIRTACGIAGRVFDRMGEIAREGATMDRVFRDFQRLCLDEGADGVPYISGGKGPLGYGDVISPARPDPLVAGDILMIDTGLTRDGYFCDFDRNFAVGAPDPRAETAWARLMEATEAGRQAARPGATAAEVFHAMDQIVTGGTGQGDAGRLGHGLGMQLTEWPSLIAGDHTVLEPGMVLTLEPGIEIEGGGVLVHEDNIVIRDGACEQLSPRASETLPRI